MAKNTIKMWTRKGVEEDGIEYTNINFGKSREFVAYHTAEGYLIAIVKGGYGGYWMNEEPTTFERVLELCKEFFCEHSIWELKDIINGKIRG